MQFVENIKEDCRRWATMTPNNLLYDRTLMWLFIILLFVGLVAVTSASIPVGSRLHNDAFYFAKRDAAYVAVSIFTCYFFMKIPMDRWQKWHMHIFFIALALLVLVAIPGIGKSINGARRWIPLGIIQFQPAEFVKLALICFLAGYFTRRYDEVRSRKLSSVKPFIVVGLFGLFLLMQPDLGSTIVLFVITFGLLFIVGVHFLQFLGLIVLGIFLFYCISSKLALSNRSYDKFYGTF